MRDKNISLEEKEQFWKEIHLSFVQSVRIAIYIAAAAFIIVGIADWFAYPGLRISLLAAKLFLLSCFSCFLYITYTRWGRKHLEFFFVFFYFILIGIALYHTLVANEPLIMKQMMVFGAVMGATIIPWPLRYHLILVAISFIVLFFSAIYFEEIPRPSLEPDSIGVVVLILATIILAIFTHNRRFDLWKVETKLRKNEKILQKQAEVTKIALEETRNLKKVLEEANIELEKLANLDGLTQISNRRYFDAYLDKEWERHRREKNALSIIFSDIDFFKPYNDTYGHTAGDDCLKKVASGIRSCLKRPSDLVARYGGEEFVIVLPNTDLNGAVRIAEKVLLEISNLKIPHEQSPVSQYLSLSIGVSSTIPEHGQLQQELIVSADRSLYQAKKSGRNQVRS